MSGFRQLHREVIGKPIASILDCTCSEIGESYDYIVGFEDDIEVS